MPIDQRKPIAPPPLAGRMAAPVLAAVGRVVGPAWVAWMRRRYRREARALGEGEIALLRGWFSEGLLRGVRVADVETIRTGPDWRRNGTAVWVASPAGLTLGDLVVLAGPLVGDGRGRLSVLFHELVHAAQFRRLGTARFCAEYLGPWARGGFRYRGIPLEQRAYALQARWNRGERFDAEAEAVPD